MAMRSRFYTMVTLLALMLGHAAAMDSRLFDALGAASYAGATAGAGDCAARANGLVSRARIMDRLTDGQPWLPAPARDLAQAGACGRLVDGPDEDGRLAGPGTD
jgi:hypothetical protein